MSDEIEILPPDEDEAEETTKARKAVGYPVFLLGLLFASALGAVGGGAMAYYLKTTPIDLAPMRSEMAGVKSSVSDLQSAQAKLDRAVKSRPAAASVDLSPLEERLAALENAPAPSVDIPDLDPEALAQLKAAQEAGFEWPDTDDLEAQIETFTARIEVLENRPQPEPVIQTTPEVSVPTAATIPFPKAALLAAIDTKPAAGGFFKRILEKNVRVVDENDPRVIIDAVEVAVTRGDIDTAKAKFDSLPSTIRSVGQAWRKSLD